jgi:hypothetical protein
MILCEASGTPSVCNMSAAMIMSAAVAKASIAYLEKEKWKKSTRKCMRRLSHLDTYTAHSGAKKAHDWMVDQFADLLTTQQVVKNRGQDCGDIDLAGYVVNETGPVTLVLDLRIVYDRVGSNTDPNLNGHLKYPNNLDQSLNDTTADKIRKYRADYNNRSPSVVSFMSFIVSTSDRLHSELVRLLFLQTHRETDRFFATSGVLSAESDRGFFHYRRAPFSTQLKSKVGLTLAKVVVLRITLNLDGVSITSRTHTHPSHSQTSRLLTSSLSLGVPVPRATQCMRDT